MRLAHPIIARTEDELVEAVRAADSAGGPLVLLGPDTEETPEAADSTVVRVATRGLVTNEDGCSADDLAFCGGVLATVAAGRQWAPFVDLAIQREWVGVECLAGLRGSVGGAAVHNLGAHGQCVADTVAAVRTWDRMAGAHRRFAVADCGFGPGTSRFRRERMPDGSRRYVVLDVAFLFPQGDLSAPIRSESLARRLGVDVGQRVLMTAVRETVLR